MRVSGDLEKPRRETDKVSEPRWVGPNDLPLLMEGRAPNDNAIFGLVKRALTSPTSVKPKAPDLY